MAELSAVTNSFASAPPSFSQKDRAEELRDARQPVSQFDNRQLAQNETVAKDQRANSATTVFAATGTSDTNAARSSVTAASSLEAGSASAPASLQQTADAFGQQLQRAALERRSRPQEDAPAQTAGASAEVRESRQNESRETRTDRSNRNESEQVQLQSPGDAGAAERAGVAEDRSARSAEVATRQEADTTAQNQSAAEVTTETPERENAENALGFATA
jgi:hypothetical protein